MKTMNSIKGKLALGLMLICLMVLLVPALPVSASAGQQQQTASTAPDFSNITAPVEQMIRKITAPLLGIVGALGSVFCIILGVKFAKAEGLYAKSINGDAFSDECRAKVIELIKQDLGKIDLVVYSLASPVRKIPSTGELVRSSLKPIGEVYRTTAVDTNKDEIIQAEIEPANEEEIANTVKVMGGQDWELWINALLDAGVLENGFKTVAYSYIGTDLTWPIYWNGTLGKAKEDLDRAATAINTKLAAVSGKANVAVLKSVITQASSAIPVMPLYISMCFKVMKDQGVHEEVIHHIFRMFNTEINQPAYNNLDEKGRIRMDSWELDDKVQNACRDMWPKITTENLKSLTDYECYKSDFLKLFGFGVANVDYDADVNPVVDFDVITL